LNTSLPTVIRGVGGVDVRLRIAPLAHWPLAIVSHPIREEQPGSLVLIRIERIAAAVELRNHPRPTFRQWSFDQSQSPCLERWPCRCQFIPRRITTGFSQRNGRQIGDRVDEQGLRDEAVRV
jgi:hypothetical protein